MMKALMAFLQSSLTKEFERVALQNNKQRTVGLIYLITFTTGIIGGSVMHFYDINSSLSLFMLGLVSFLGWLLNRAGHVNSSVAILMTTLIIVIQFNIFSGFGIHDVAIIAWPAFIFFAGLLFGSRAIPYVTALIILLAVATGVILNAQFSSDYSDTGDLIVMLLILLAFSIIARLILRSNEQSIHRLQQSKERFQAIYHSINDAIVIHDSQTGAILDVNEKMLEMFGYTYSEALLLDNILTISSGIPPYTQENALEWIGKAATQGAQHFEWQAKDKSGRLFWVDVNMKLATIASQTLVLVSVHDITDRKQADIALSESEGRYRELFNHASLAIFQSGLEGEVLAVNPEFARMFGFASPTEVVAAIHKASDLFADPKRREEIIRLKTEHPDLATFENLYRRNDGSTFLGKLNLRQAVDSNNRLLFFEGFIEDITDRKRVELQQEVLYQVLRAVINQLDLDLVAHSAVETIVRLTGYPHVCIALPDKDGAHWVVRGAAGSLAAELGATYPIHQGVIGRAFKTGQTQWVRDILDDPNYVRDVSATDAPALRSEFVAPMRRGDHLLGTLNIESARVDAFDDADIRMIQSLADIISLALENASLYGEAQQEISERKRAEVAQRESHQLLEGTFASLRDAVFIIDANTTTITDCNPAAAEMFGYIHEDMLGRTTEFIHVDWTALEAFRKHLLPAVAEKGFLFLSEFKMKRRDGTVFPTEHTVLPLEGEQSKRIGWVSVVRDITERKRAEAKILAALEEKETLLREVHHRVKNNLQAMIALIEMQAGVIPDESTRQFLKELEGQARTMSLVYEQLYQSVNLARVQMAPYLQQLTFYISETFGCRRMVQLNLDVAPIALDVAQAMPCGLIVNELFTNILKHAYPPGFQGQPIVHIVLQDAGETHRLTVADNGVGLPPGLDWQASRSLGLRLVNLWATHQLGGALNVSGDPGTTYTITFPKAAGGSS